jgi:hypothetical protein
MAVCNDLAYGKESSARCNFAFDETFKKAPSSKRKSAEDQALPGMQKSR